MKQIYLTSPKISKLIPVDEIDIITSNGNYFSVWHNGIHYTTIGHLVDVLKQLPGFFRANRQLIFNLSYLSHINDWAQTVVLTNGKEIEISRRQLQNLRKLLKSQSIKL